MPDPVSHTAPLTPAQADKLQALLRERGWHFLPKEHTLFAAEKKPEKVNVAVYAKGPKVLVQGKGTGDFLRFILEPEILGAAQLGYEEDLHPEMFEPHIGVDESGKGDFFGPLVIAGAYVNPGTVRALREAGVRDSKAVTSDAAIRRLAEVVREAPGVAWDVILVGPAKYNVLYKKFGNLNRLLAWGHARVIENLAAQRPTCLRALSDQFADPSLIRRALGDRAPGITLESRTKAESDPAVAAASILAREAFIDWMDRHGERLGLGAPLPRGASALVKEVAGRLVSQHGPEVLREHAKTHFRTAHDVAPEHFEAPAPREFARWKR